MSPERDEAIWKVSSPSRWQTPPARMSVSTLLELEACPRRWALSNSEYSHIWTGKGYPRPLHLAATEGTVVHRALQVLTSALVASGATLVTGDSVVRVLRKLGGYTSVIRDCIAEALSVYAGSPRARRRVDDAQRQLASRLPDLRCRVQQLLSRIALWSPSVDVGTKRGTPDGLRRCRCGHGSFAELRLQATGIHWYGVVDLLTVSPDCCEIRDFKTGKPKPDHEFQLQVYALLWAMDGEANPAGRLADRLVISYEGGDIDVPAPDRERLSNLERELVARTDTVLRNLAVSPPVGRPQEARCQYCEVRHLCDDFWRHHRNCPHVESAGLPQFGDIQLRISDRHGPASWDGVVESSTAAASGQDVLLRTVDLPFELRPGYRVRLLNVCLSALGGELDDGVHPVTIATMGSSTEMFSL